MDQFYQVMYGPTQDKLKYAGTASLGLSIIASFGRADLGGYIGLLAILTVITSSAYLLKLIFIFGPLSLIVALYYLFESHGWAWIFLQLLHIVIQGATIWYAWQSHQELSAQEGYDVPREGDQNTNGVPPTHSDPFQAYVPPRSQQSTIYSDQPAEQPPKTSPQNPPQGQQGRKEEGPRGENLL